MNFTSIATTAPGDQPAQVVRDTVAALQGRPVSGGLVFATGMSGAAVAAELARALPGVAFVGATTGSGTPGLVALWFPDGLRLSAATGAVNASLAERAVTAGGFKAFRSRVGVLLARDGRPGLPSLFEVLPRGLAFLGADVTEVFSRDGLVDGALLLSDWPTRVVVAFEGTGAALEHSGLVRETVVGTLQLQAAEVKGLYGVPDRSPLQPVVATLLLSNAKERAEG